MVVFILRCAYDPAPRHTTTLATTTSHAGLDWRTRHELIYLLKKLKAECTMLVVSGSVGGQCLAGCGRRYLVRSGAAGRRRRQAGSGACPKC